MWMGARVVGLVIWVVWSPCQALMTGQKTPLHSILRPARKPTLDQRLHEQAALAQLDLDQPDQTRGRHLEGPAPEHDQSAQGVAQAIGRARRTCEAGTRARSVADVQGHERERHQGQQRCSHRAGACGGRRAQNSEVLWLQISEHDSQACGCSVLHSTQERRR